MIARRGILRLLGGAGAAAAGKALADGIPKEAIPPESFQGFEIVDFSNKVNPGPPKDPFTAAQRAAQKLLEIEERKYRERRQFIRDTRHPNVTCLKSVSEHFQIELCVRRERRVESFLKLS